MELKNGNFSFLHFLFSQLWTTLPRKLMKTPAIVITYFQTPFQIVHIYQVLQWECFFLKLSRPFQYNIHSLNFEMLLPENLWEDLQIVWLISKFLSRSTRSQFFVIWKCLLKISQLFQNVHKLFIILATLSNICHKTYEKTYQFFDIFKVPLDLSTFAKSQYHNIFLKKNVVCLNIFINFHTSMTYVFYIFIFLFLTYLAKKATESCRILLHNDSNSQHRRIKKQCPYQSLAATSHLSHILKVSLIS